MLQTIQDNWEHILQNLKEDQELSELSFSTWIAPLKPISLEDKILTIQFAGQSFGIDYLNKKYAFFLQFQIQEITGIECSVHFVLESETPGLATPIHKENEGPSIDNGLNPKYTFDSFVVGSNNRMASAAALAVAESPAEAFNPLFIYGGVGLGKTHLMHSIGNFILKNNPSLKIMYTTSEVFTNELIDSIRNKNTSAATEFREKYRGTDVLLIDDIQFIVDKESTQEEFFHTFNSLYQAKKQIILSSDRPPNEMRLLEERLRSRFAGGLTVSISEPDYETRMAILQRKAESEGYMIDNEIFKYIASHVKSNIRELEGALTKIVALSKLENKAINIESVADTLRDQIHPEEVQEITPELVIRTVAQHYDISIEDICSSKRSKDIAYPRQVAMYLCKDMTSVPLQIIGQKLGRRDHTTIIHGCEKIKKDLIDNESLQNTINILKKKINPLI
ncbi:Chromosomal replication initiator protein DnaA [Lachnospiraceae bacterium TWA4]|nr:Chromosomal replication initiator protein DnaA [Lachnospiraceae bacterium TWA4]